MAIVGVPRPLFDLVGGVWGRRPVGYEVSPRSFGHLPLDPFLGRSCASCPWTLTHSPPVNGDDWSAKRRNFFSEAPSNTCTALPKFPCAQRRRLGVNDRVIVTHPDHGIMTRPPTSLFSFKCLSHRYLEALKEKTAGSLLRYQTCQKWVTFALAKSVGSIETLIGT